MTFSALHGLAGGALLTGALVAFVLHPAALAPHAVASPALSLPGDDAPSHPASAARPAPPVVIVYVAGAVAHPGVYSLPSAARAADAVAKAGGLTRDADPAAVNLAAHVADGDEIAVPRIGDAAPAGGRATTRGGHRAKKPAHRRRRRAPAADGADDASAAADAPARLVDLNAADAATLATIPGIGPTLAERIVEFREVNGPYPTVDALADVSGITASRFDAIAAYLTVRP